MRKYAKNSPQAAARIVALTLIADGDVGQAELALLNELGVHHQLGLERDALQGAPDRPSGLFGLKAGERHWALPHP